ncbi:MAG: hypothetical protein BMS9Abin02_2069 [Anaerolineae bacterium]|nr:MAG: hypothetical protein BMS9Abin02_2069 [Anaerolineae bacterium]
MTETSDLIVFWVVVVARFLIPLTIPRYPLPGIIAALVIDAIDQTIFQTFTNLNLDSYQGYDKALDIYYLTIAYIATMRNWTNLYAFQVSRFLWYYRLFGVTLFELTYEPPGPRWLLLIFPNVFEYFFIFYEIVRLRWDPVRLTKRATLIWAAAIWIFIKIPQELWIHILQLDMTDFIKENIFGVPADTPPADILADNLWVLPALAIAAVLIVVLVRWLLKKLPLKDWDLSFDADSHQDEDTGYVETGTLKPISDRFFNMVLVEKIVLVSLVGIIFAQILPDVRASNLELAAGVAFVIILNTVISHWLARRGRELAFSITQFVVMTVINFGLVLLYAFLLPNFDGSINLGNTLFFILLLTLIVTLFDHYYPVYQARFAESN